MSKILLFIFAIQPIIFCAVFGVTLLNGFKLTEALSYFCVVAAMMHYMIIGLKEILEKKNN
jgi:uncharacterized membrane protein YbhN (UPF0104 family)